MHEVEGIIYGKVHGVGFRVFLKNKANEFGVRGWVANTPAGRVEFLVQGTKEALDEFLKHARKGPAFSRIDDVEVEWHEHPQDTYTEFTIEEHED